jgi:hypothetical protein
LVSDETNQPTNQKVPEKKEQKTPHQNSQRKQEKKTTTPIPKRTHKQNHTPPMTKLILILLSHPICMWLWANSLPNYPTKQTTPHTNTPPITNKK